jgi:hypothetical protein
MASFSAGGADLFCIRQGLVSMRFNVERGQGFSELLALGECRRPVAIMAIAVEAQFLAGEQAVGDRGDGDF